MSGPTDPRLILREDEPDAGVTGLDGVAGARAILSALADGRTGGPVGWGGQP